MKAQTVEQVLKAGLWIIQNVGWCQGSFSRRNQQGQLIAVCANGALDKVEWEGDENLRREAYNLLLAEAINLGFSGVVRMNDSSDDNAKELVITAYQRAIQKAKQQGM